MNDRDRDKLEKKIRKVLGQKKNSERIGTHTDNNRFDMGEVRILKVEEDPNFKQPNSSRSKHQEFVQNMQSVTIINIGSIGDKDYDTYRESSSPKVGNNATIVNINNGKVGKSKTRNYGKVNGNVTIKDGKLYYEDGTEVNEDEGR